MNILIINNGTRYIRELLRRLSAHRTTVVPFREFSGTKLSVYDAIILSGGHSLTVSGHGRQYARELKLIRTSRRPIIGICLGFELIATAFGAPLERIKRKEKGNLPIRVTGRHPMLSGVKRMVVYENHRWAVKKAGKQLKELASSKDGCEIFVHKSKPIFGFQFHPEKTRPMNDGSRLLERCLGYISSLPTKKKR